MDREKLTEQLKIDEGVKLTVYQDSLGLLTGGVGHQLRREDRLRLGDPITEAQCATWLDADITAALTTCARTWPGAFDRYPEDVQQVCANMAFNLGYHRLQTFTLFRQAISMRDWGRAALEMRSSRWYRQVGDRAERLAQRMEALPGT